jgi:hypothetical protein
MTRIPTFAVPENVDTGALSEIDAAQLRAVRDAEARERERKRRLVELRRIAERRRALNSFEWAARHIHHGYLSESLEKLVPFIRSGAVSIDEVIAGVVRRKADADVPLLSREELEEALR